MLLGGVAGVARRLRKAPRRRRRIGRGRGGRECDGGGSVRRADGHDARAEFNADCDVVVRGEAAFAEADGETGFAAS